MRRILVIRLGAFGDFVQSFPAFAAISAHHATDEVSLLTAAPFARLARPAPWFDRVMVDRRPGWWNILGLWRLAGRLRQFDFVYDLQTSARSSRYYWLAGRPHWSGIAAGASHRHAHPGRDAMHTLERQQNQLHMAGIAAFPPADLSWLHGNAFDLPPDFALLVPGAAAHRPGKRWPVQRFGELASVLADRGLVPVILGTLAERPLAAAIRAACPAAIDLSGQTTLADLAELGRRARIAVGNDTGPMHMIAAVGGRCVVLFSAESDPALTAPRGPDGAWPIVLRSNALADLPVARVAAALPTQ